MNSRTIISLHNTARLVLLCALIIQDSGAAAELFRSPRSSLTIDTVGRTIQQLTEFQKPNQMMDILPNRPVAAHDKNGNKLFFTPGGALSLKVSPDGTMSYSLGNVTRERDSEGNVVRTTKAEEGSDRMVIRNEKGEVLGYQEVGYGGKVLREYDHENNLTKTYKYNEYGKSIEYVMDELSQTKTVFNSKGQAECDIDFEGNRVAVYQYDRYNRLANKTDQYGNTTYFNENGNMTETRDYRNNVIARYTYKDDELGRYVLDTVEDPQTNNVTYFENGRQTVTRNQAGAVVRDYMWDGSKLVCTFDRETRETTWYDIGGKPLHTSYNNEHITTWLYHKGRRVGVWDAREGSVTIFRNEREEMKIGGVGDEPPTAEQIQRWIDDGLIQDAQPPMN